MAKDKLTNLWYFDDFKEEVQKWIWSKKREYILVSLNIANFKYINSVYGYQRGDELLRQVSDFFAHSNENCRIATRIHSDRFAIVTARAGMTDEELVQRIDRRHKAFMHMMEEQYPMTAVHINAGAYIIEGDEDNISEIIDKAEAARKAIMDNYIQTVCFYTDALEEKINLDRSIVPLFEKSLKEDNILIYLQPKFDVDGQKIIGAEALARIQGAAGQLISPAVFVPVLEKTGLIIQLDVYVVRKVFALLKAWIERGWDPVPISINLSRMNLLQDDVWLQVNEEVARYQIPKKYVEFEVTETVFFEDLDYIINRIRTIQTEGFKVSMDDFGSGYSSLNMVGILPVDIIKFDRGFVQNSIGTRKGLEIMAGLVDIFKRIGLEVICEGVETREEEQIIKACGCNMVQGYLYDKPLVISEFERKYLSTGREAYSV